MTDSSDTSHDTTVIAPRLDSYPYTPRWVMIALVVAFALIGYLIYALYQQRQQTNQAFDSATKRAGVLSAQLDKTNSAIGDLKAELQVTSQKLGLTGRTGTRAGNGSVVAQGTKRPKGECRKTPATDRTGSAANFDANRASIRCAERHEERRGRNAERFGRYKREARHGDGRFERSIRPDCAQS